MATYASNLDGKANFGGGGGTDFFTAPNEYFVDPTLSADASKRQYPTIAAAISAGTSANHNPILIRIAEGQTHTWPGTGLNMAPGDVIIYSQSNVGVSTTLRVPSASSVKTDNALVLRTLNLDVGVGSVWGVLSLVLDNCVGSFFITTGDPPTSGFKGFEVRRSNLLMGITAGGADTSGGSLFIGDSTISFGDIESFLWNHTASGEFWSVKALNSTLQAYGSEVTVFNVGPAQGFLDVSLTNVDLIILGIGFGTLTIYSSTAGVSGPLWTDSRISMDESFKPGRNFVFGDSSPTPQGLEIVWPGGFGGGFPTDAPNGTLIRSNTSPDYGLATFDESLSQWRGENRTVFLQGASGVPNGTPQTLTTVFEGDSVVNLGPSSLSTLYRIQGTIIAGRDSADCALWDVDWILVADSSPTSISTLSGGSPTLLHESNGGQFLVSLDLVPGPPTGFSVSITKNVGSVNARLYAKLQITEENA